MSQDAKPRMGYTLKVTPVGSINIQVTAAGTPKLTFRAAIRGKGGRTLERTVVAKGKAHNALIPLLRIGEEVSIRAFYDRMPANEDGTRGAEYVTAIGLPKAA